MGDFGACDAAEAQATAMDAERVAERAREFMFKPDGGAAAHRWPQRLPVEPLFTRASPCAQT